MFAGGAAPADNDLLAANILEREGDVHLIDFEYGGLNYRSASLSQARLLP